MENIDPSDMIIATDTIKAINQTVLDQLIDYRDPNPEEQITSKTPRATMMNAYAHQAVFA